MGTSGAFIAVGAAAVARGGLPLLGTFGDAVSIQRVSYRHNRPIDFRSVQGALRADGVGNLLSGLLGTLPNTTYSTSISMVGLTGVSAPRVALYGGGLLVILALFPKVSAALQGARL